MLKHIFNIYNIYSVEMTSEKNTNYKVSGILNLRLKRWQ